MKKIMIAFLSFCLLLFGSFGSARAIPVTYQFSVILNTSVNDPGNILDGSIQYGDTLDGSFTFDSESADLNSSPIEGRYIGGEFVATVGNYTLNSNVSISIVDGQGVNVSSSYYEDDQFYVSSIGVTIFSNGTDLFSSLGFVMHLAGNDGSIFLNDDLPSTVPALLDFRGRNWIMTGSVTKPDSTQSRLDLDGSIVSLTSSDPVPEPSTMLLFGTGLAGLAGSRLRRQKK